MRLVNTSPYDDREVEALVRYGMKGINTGGVEVHVKSTSKAWQGRAWNGVPKHIKGIHPHSRYFVTIGVGNPDKYPTENWSGLKRVPEMGWVNNWAECIVMLAAHEGRHIYHYQHSKPRSEVDAVRYELKVLAKFREEFGLPSEPSGIEYLKVA